MLHRNGSLAIWVAIYWLLSVTVFDSTHGKKHSYETFTNIGSYKIHKKPLDWKSAYIECALQNAHLLVMDSVKEAKAITGMINRKYRALAYNRRFIVGVHSMYFLSYWMTIYGKPLHNKYELWEKGQPDGVTKLEMCAAINQDAEYVDMPCTGLEFPYICEKNEDVRNQTVQPAPQ